MNAPGRRPNADLVLTRYAPPVVIEMDGSKEAPYTTYCTDPSCPARGRLFFAFRSLSEASRVRNQHLAIHHSGGAA